MDRRGTSALIGAAVLLSACAAHAQTVQELEGRRLVSAGLDGEVVVWDAETGRPLHSRRFPAKTLCAAFAPDGKHVGVGADQDLCYLMELPRRIR